MDNNIENNIETPQMKENTGEARNLLEEALLASEQNIGEHDIVIDEDFDINIDVAEVSADIPTGGNPSTDNANSQEQTELGSEQSGNITF